MTQRFSNNARSRLVGAITNASTSFMIEPSTADLFPVGNTTDWLTMVDWFKATLENSAGQVEIVYVGVRNLGSGVFSNVLRGQDGTTAITFDAGSTVGVRITALDVEGALSGSFEQMAVAADLNVGGNATIDGKITHNGVESRTVPVGGIIMYSGLIASIPGGWQLCNGTNGTPDLRDRFVIGAHQDDAGAAKTNITGALTTSGGTKDSVLVSHTHTATVGTQSVNHTHSGSTSTSGDHVHTTIAGTNSSSAPTGPAARGTDAIVGSNPTSNAGAHNHSFTTGATSNDHTHAVTNSTVGVSATNANLPPYLALAFIMCMPYP